MSLYILVILGWVLWAFICNNLSLEGPIKKFLTPLQLKCLLVLLCQKIRHLLLFYKLEGRTGIYEAREL